MQHKITGRYGSDLLKWVLACLTAMVIFFSTGLTSHAETIEEQDDNDTMATAQLITANRETAAGCVNGTYSGQYVVDGYTSSTDDDWYKVYLSAGTQYVTCNGSSFDFFVYDSDGQLVYNKTYSKTGYGVTAYPFQATGSDYYYVKVTGVTSSSANYKLLVGGTTYSLSNYSTTLGSITLSSKDVSKSLDLSDNSSIPDGAIVHTITISNVKSTATNGVTVKNSSSGTSLSLSASTLSKSGFVSSNMKAKTTWKFTFKYKKAITIAPKVTFYYVYPVTSTEVD